MNLRNLRKNHYVFESKNNIGMVEAASNTNESWAT
jgi:hypothetical protein